MKTKLLKPGKISSFDLEEGDILLSKYKIVQKLGQGWEGEVYKIRELKTGIERAAKLFFPKRNKKLKTSVIYAKRLHKLRECPIVIKYHSHDQIMYKGCQITMLVSEYVDGELLSEYVRKLPGKRMSVFQAVHLLHALTLGVEHIHHLKEYHGDLHTDNIIVNNCGLSFDLKVIDMFYWGKASRDNRHDDICDLIRVFHECIGGRKYYSRQPKVVKRLCCGLRKPLIIEKFRSVSSLRHYLERQSWN